jgi:diguanylate cyclase (GGDEF)-like protein
MFAGSFWHRQNVLYLMQMWRSASGARREFPSEIYISLVTSLFSDPRTLLAGSIGSASAALITAVKSGELLIWLCTMAIALIACVRAADMREFKRQKPALDTAKAIRRWELRYVIGSSAYMAALGTWCLIVFAKSADPEIQLLSFSMTLVNMIGVAGRNFGSRLLVIAQLVCGGGPLLVALLLAGKPYYSIYACVLFPFFVSFKGISDRLRRTFLDAVVATRDVGLLAGRFDAALNNMSHGLCMLDAGRRIVIANSRLPDVLGTDPAVFRAGVPLRKLLRECAKVGLFANANLRNLAAEFAGRLAGSILTPLSIRSRDGRTLALTFRSMSNGGSVILVDDITEQRNVEARIERLAHCDALTGLPNRTSFRETMDRVLKHMDRTGPCAVLFIDLDGFKQINDTLGHPSGDILLRTVADRLRGIVRDSDVIARLGGDEFVILQSPIRSPEDASALAGRVVETFGAAYDVDGHEVVIGASIGIALAPNDGTDGDLLLKNADMALYRAKSDGRGAWRFFEPEMDARARARRKLELDLRSALASDAFVLHYQPLVNLQTRRIRTCEALLRWPHAERGMIPPAEFIPVAEEIGLIVDIGNSVLRKACLEAVTWPSHARVSVNLSAIQIRRGSVVRAVRDALASSGLPANRLEVEITESVLVQDTEAARVVLAQLRELGVTISLDDFGTGYSSLSYLHSFPLDKIKIDRSFLLGIETSERSRMLLHGVARLSAELGLSVVVEGVETEDQLALIVNDIHVDEVQGYLFSRPIPGGQIRELLRGASPPVMKVPREA